MCNISFKIYFCFLFDYYKFEVFIYYVVVMLMLYLDLGERFRLTCKI